MSQQINLFNPVFMTQKKYFSVEAMIKSLGLLVLGTLVFYGYAAYQVDALERQNSDARKQLAAEQTRLVNFANEYSPQQARQRLAEELKQLEAQQAAQQALLEKMKSGAVGNTGGYSEYMRAFARQTVKGLWLTSFEITGDGTQMKLGGAALAPQLLPIYIQQLNRERVMRGKTFAALQMQQMRKDDKQAAATPYVTFTLRSTSDEGDGK